MRRCEAKTAAGRQCLNGAQPGVRFCAKHRNRFDQKQAAWISGGALVGAAIVPGVGGLAGGAIAGWIVDNLARKDGNMGKKRAFVSFDFDNDKALKDFIIGQAKLSDSPFEVVDCSLKEAKPEKTWEDHARTAIKGSDIVLVMVGPKTHKASGVLKEVQMARESGVKIVQIIGYKDGNYTAVPDAGRLYAWSWDNLKKLLS
jgi:hypothetical protein